MTGNRTIHIAITLGIALFFGLAMQAQTTTTNTNCNVNGNMANCTSTSTSNAEQQQRSYEAGQQIGAALGKGIAAVIRGNPQARANKAQDKALVKFCAARPGERAVWRDSYGNEVRSERCPTDTEKGVMAANVFMSRHHDFIPGPANSDAITAYIGSHNLDPREENSYERAYKDLKKDGQLKLYAK
jgi:hypothetical protein